MFRLLVETDEPSESQLATLDHVAARIEALAGKVKNAEGRDIPLSAPALEILAGLPKTAQSVSVTC